MPLSVVVCTRNRPERLAATLTAMRAQTLPHFELIVVDQSDRISDGRKVDQRWPRLSVIVDRGRGLARARNIGWRAASAEWIAFFDDDIRPTPGWVEGFCSFVAGHPDADTVSGEMFEDGAEVFPVAEVTRLEGRWVPPERVGFGGCTAVHRDTLRRLGGWDERFGRGATEFPATEDMEFNYRLMRSGGVAYLVPGLEVEHIERRAPETLPALHRTYSFGWAGVCMKHLLRGDLLGAFWLWGLGLGDATGSLYGAVRHRSWLSARIALRKLEGLFVGAVRGARQTW